MEEKLAEFRRKKAKENLSKKIQSICSSIPSRFSFLSNTSSITDELNENEINEVKEVKTNWVIISFKAFLWLTFFILFIHWQFGTIYLIISLFYVIYCNLGVGTGRRKNQLSAYSVFNPRFEKLQGTFSGEDYDRQLRHGSIYRS